MFKLSNHCLLNVKLYPEEKYRITVHAVLIFPPDVVPLEQRMETDNVTKRTQPDQRAENRQRIPMGLGRSVKIPHPKDGFSWLLKFLLLYQD